MLGGPRLDEATAGLLSKRAYDVAGCASGFPGKPLKVFLNGQRLPLASFSDVRTPADQFSQQLSWAVEDDTPLLFGSLRST